MDLLNEVWRECREYLRILWRRRWVCVAVGACPLIAAGFLFVLSPPLYKSSALLALSPTSLESQFFLSLQQWGRLQYLSNASPMHTLKAIMTSEPLVQSVLEELSWKDRDGEPVPPSEFADAGIPKMVKYGGGLRVRFDANAEVFEVTGYASDLEKSAELANALCAKFLRFMSERNKQEAKEALAALDLQLPELEGKIKESDQELRSFRMEHGFLDFEEEMDRLVSLREDLKNEEVVARRGLEEARAGVKELRLKIGEIPEFQEALVILERNPLYASYSDEMMRVESRLAFLRANAQDTHPEVAACESQLEELGEKLRGLVEETFRSRQSQRSDLYDSLVSRLYSTDLQIVTQRSRLEVLGGQLEDLAGEMNDLSELQNRWEDLSREREALTNRQSRLLEAREMASLALNLDATNAFQFQEARTDLAEAKEYKAFPKILSLAVVSATLSVVFAFAAALLADLVDPRVMRWDRVSDLLRGETVLETKSASQGGMGWQLAAFPGLHAFLWRLEEALPQGPNGPRGAVGVACPLGTPGGFALTKSVSLALREAGLSVTVVDLSEGTPEFPPGGHLTIQDALRGREVPVYEPAQGVRWIGRGEGDLPFRSLTELVRSLREMGSSSDVTVWNVPPLTQGTVSETLLSRADVSVLVVQPKRTFIPRLRESLEALRRVGKPRLIVSVGG